MHLPIAHRGPDGEGMLLVDAASHPHRFGQVFARTEDQPPTAGLAFRRLKIVDVSESADQPMGSDDGSIWLAFNGEIYNFRELREELAAYGHTFRSTGDTEVILAAYQRWGEECFQRLEGMWAVVIFDLRSRRAVICRDRLGIKPLYWMAEGGSLFLASEIKQLLAVSSGRPRLITNVVTSYLQGARFPNLYETFFEGIRPIPAASWFTWDLHGETKREPDFHEYWSIPETSGSHLTYPQAVEALDTLMCETVASHSIADVGVGALLSGGLDSSIVAVRLAEARRSRHMATPTFSFAVRDCSPDLSEMPYVEAVARENHLQNFEITFDARWIRDNVDDVLETIEEPALAMPIFAQYRVFQLCRQHSTTVILDGQGSDEIFAGYPYDQRLLVIDRLRRHEWRAMTKELRAIARNDQRNPLDVLIGYVWPSVNARTRRSSSYPWLQVPPVRPQEIAAFTDRGKDPSLVNRQLYWDVKWGNVRVILDFADKSAMRWSIEARVPYLDRRIVEFAFSLPDHFKVGAGERKRVLRDVGRKFLPAAVTERRTRLGFGTPDQDTIQGPLRQSIEETTRDAQFSALPLFDRPGLRMFVDDFSRGGHKDFGMMWRLWMLGRYMAHFNARL